MNWTTEESDAAFKFYQTFCRKKHSSHQSLMRSLKGLLDFYRPVINHLASQIVYVSSKAAVQGVANKLSVNFPITSSTLLENESCCSSFTKKTLGLHKSEIKQNTFRLIQRHSFAQSTVDDWQPLK